VILSAIVLSVIQAINEQLGFLDVLSIFLVEAIALSISATVFVFMLFGGINLLKHYLMRIMLAQRDYMPMNIID
jgi:hypothetical protein